MAAVKTPDFHGWSRTQLSSHGERRPALHVGRMPGCKRAVLYEANGSIRVLARFDSDEAAERAVALIDWLCGLKGGEAEQ